MRFALLWATKSHSEDANMPTQQAEVVMGDTYETRVWHWVRLNMKDDNAVAGASCFCSLAVNLTLSAEDHSFKSVTGL